MRGDVIDFHVRVETEWQRCTQSSTIKRENSIEGSHNCEIDDLETYNMVSSRPQASNPPGVPIPPQTYSQLCVTPLHPTSRLITLAGQTGLQSDGSIDPSITVQARNAYKAIHACLKAAGATPRDIVHVRHYIVKESGDKEKDKLDVVDRGWGEEWMEFMDREAEGHRPPDTVVGVASLAKKAVLYECEVSAIVS
jgi:enamine deaminase RidA (YjgF/YER057c/UK114 family)